MLTLIKSCCLTVSDKVIMQCFNCQSMGTMAIVLAAD